MSPVIDRSPFWPPRLSALFRLKPCRSCKKRKFMPESTDLCGSCQWPSVASSLRKEAKAESVEKGAARESESGNGR